MSAHVYNAPMIGLNTVIAYGSAPAASLTSAPTGTTPAAWIKSFKPDHEVGTLAWGNLAQAVERNLPTKFKGGKPTMGISYLPGDATVSALWGYFKGRTTVVWLVTFPDTSAMAFNAFISKFSPNVEDEESEIDAEIELTIDGDVMVYPVAS